MSWAIKLHMNKVKLRDLQRKLGVSGKPSTSGDAIGAVSSSSAPRRSVGILPKSALAAPISDTIEGIKLIAARSVSSGSRRSTLGAVAQPPPRDYVIEIDDDEE